MKTTITLADMPDFQAVAIRCALADLTGAWQAWTQEGCPDSVHDWQSHEQSMLDLANAFDLNNELPEELA